VPTHYVERCVPTPVFTSVDKRIRRILNNVGQTNSSLSRRLTLSYSQVFVRLDCPHLCAQN